ncbi:hypothetical protein METHB2_860008 [Candidatus Methylobacter favarea]|uniref:Uncharacterized protein n=1 Tax=Candidatus Methylobacter favarea TaxID=2707345 RepID=A0A8S0X9Z9_9GAMM|nr:hypothetical protein [Candidatus Methylobacter favarea]CAA9892866.1 hypothetical protein METHB2_860008 [Candidatus Methylobacter favarea]
MHTDGGKPVAFQCKRWARHPNLTVLTRVKNQLRPAVSEAESMVIDTDFRVRQAIEMLFGRSELYQKQARFGRHFWNHLRVSS